MNAPHLDTLFQQFGFIRAPSQSSQLWKALGIATLGAAAGVVVALVVSRNRQHSPASTPHRLLSAHGIRGKVMPSDPRVRARYEALSMESDGELIDGELHHFDGWRD
ncbi:MAG: hypothetical protein Q8O67_21780 [Deltaproteobacteria bacterium]|nr:hypothetical protein [Deltaproteobacteria bacterium]